jgi:RecB family endonuclease NucS
METLEAQKHNKPSAPMAMRKQHSLDQLAAQNTSQIEELSVEAADDTTSNSMDTGSNSEATQQGSEAESGAE